MKFSYTLKPGLAVLIACLVVSCNTQEKGDAGYKTYSDEKTGWTTEYPASWKKMSEEEIDELEGRGQQMMESTIHEKLAILHQNLLWLKKDAFNSFTSNSQAYDSIEDGPYAEFQELSFHTILETYDAQGIPYDATFGKVVIDSIAFSTMEITVYAPEKKRTIINQIMYDALVTPSQALTININFNNNKDREVLTNIVNSSKFKTQGK